MPEGLSAILTYDYAIEFLKHLPWFWVLVFAFAITFVENIFPPSPSDSILLFMGSLVTLGVVDFIPLLIFSTLGSTCGFLLMFYIGDKFGTTLTRTKKFSFINDKNLEKPEAWFKKYGYYLIVVNRFLSGTRAVISFFAGMSKLNFTKTLILSTISAALWNFILIELGVIFSKNLNQVINYMSMYGKILFPIIALLIVFYLIKIYFFSKNSSSESKD